MRTTESGFEPYAWERLNPYTTCMNGSILPSSEGFRDGDRSYNDPRIGTPHYDARSISKGSITMEYKYVLTEKRDGVYILALNRPEKRNALCSEMWADIAHALVEFENDDESRVLVITNKGPCFCAGSDLEELAAGTNHPPEGFERNGFATITGYDLKKPVIAAIEGYCMGGGTEIVMSVDLAVASSNSTFGLPEVKRGLLATGGAAFLKLGRAIPVKFAMELLLTGDPIDAQTAQSWGMVNHVVEPGCALDAALELASRIAANAPIAVAESKRLLYQCMDKPWMREGNLAWDANLFADREIKKTEDAHEGEVAFAEKRAPVWKNR